MNEQTRSRTALLCWLVLAAFAATTARADWLVTRAGERVETVGGWELRGRMVVFERPGGTLASLRLSEVDLDASEAATEKAKIPTPSRPVEAAPRPKATRVITTEDVGEGTPGAEGPALIVERLRQAHSYQDVGMAMGLVNWQDVDARIRDYVETQFEWMMERRIRSVQFIEAAPEETQLQEVQDGTTYEPNVEVAGRIEIAFVPDPDQQELSLTFHVGTRLGSYFIAAPTEARD
ncbi:MAG: hypothetical protein GY719_43085 [bacterium]|nr:hypothetical protein [bacterium]